MAGNDERRGCRNGSYGRDLLTAYGWIESLTMPASAGWGGVTSWVAEKYRRWLGIFVAAWSRKEPVAGDALKPICTTCLTEPWYCAQ